MAGHEQKLNSSQAACLPSLSPSHALLTEAGKFELLDSKACLQGLAKEPCLKFLAVKEGLAGAQNLHSCCTTSQHPACQNAAFVKLPLMCQPSLSPIVHLHTCTAAMLASHTAAKSLAGTQMLHSCSSRSQHHA